MMDNEQLRPADAGRLDPKVVPLGPERAVYRTQWAARLRTWADETRQASRVFALVDAAECNLIAAHLEECTAEIERQADEVRKLRAFAIDIMECWPEGDVDGSYLQDMAEKHGLLVPERRYEPCGETCTCAGTVEHADWVDGVTCYRRTALLKGHV